MGTSSNKRRVLLIIDDDEIFQFTAKHLNKQDQVFDTIFCHSTIDSALQHLREVKGTEQAPDVILLDIRLKNDDDSGWTFLKKFDTEELRSIVERATLYIVSSSIDDKDRQRANRHPLVSGYLEKPLRFGMMKEL